MSVTIFCFISPNSVALQTHYVTVIDYIVCTISSSTTGQNCPTLQPCRSLCDSWATCFTCHFNFFNSLFVQIMV